MAVVDAVAESAGVRCCGGLYARMVDRSSREEGGGRYTLTGFRRGLDLSGLLLFVRSAGAADCVVAGFWAGEADLLPWWEGRSRDGRALAAVPDDDPAEVE